eukprot:1180152-Prorocentrum_minimum.AAC.1
MILIKHRQVASIGVDILKIQDQDPCTKERCGITTHALLWVIRLGRRLGHFRKEGLGPELGRPLLKVEHRLMPPAPASPVKPPCEDPRRHADYRSRRPRVAEQKRRKNKGERRGRQAGEPIARGEAVYTTQRVQLARPMCPGGAVWSSLCYACDWFRGERAARCGARCATRGTGSEASGRRGVEP